MSDFDFNCQLLALHEYLFRFACKLTGSTIEANDLLQETYLKALCHCDRFTAESNFKAWICTIMRHIFINEYWAKVNHPDIYTLSDPVLFSALSNDLDYASFNQSLEVKEIHKAIQELPPKFAPLFMMYMNGFKYREIADRSGMPLGTVKHHIFHCKRLLRKTLSEFIE